MAWNNGPPLIVYHGCDVSSAQAIVTGSIDLAHCKTFTDFGQGFYTTTNLRQAKNWANVRCRMLAVRARRAKAPPSQTFVASIVQFTIKRAQLSALDDLCFVWENAHPS